MKSKAIILSAVFFVTGCTNLIKTEYVVIDPAYQIVTEKNLFQDKTDLMVSDLSLSDHPGVTHYPNVRVSLTKGSKHPDIVIIRLKVDELLKVSGLSFNADGLIYNLSNRKVVNNDLDSYDYGYSEFLISRKLMEKITWSNIVTVQISTDNGLIQKVLTNGAPTVLQDAFKSFLRAG